MIPPAPTLRHVWLCADDYGISPGVSAAIRDLLGRGRINATSVMVVAPSFDATEARALAEVGGAGARPAIGLHVTLTHPFRPLRETYRPLHDGAFLPLAPTLARALLRRLDAASLAAEVEAQLAAFEAAFGRPPDFIDGHHHVQLFPGVRDGVLSAAKRRAPDAWLRQCGRPAGHRGPADPKGLLLDRLSRGFRRRAQALGLAVNPAFAGAYDFGARPDLERLFAGFLRTLPAGGVVMCHPGHVDGALRRLDHVTDLRQAEYDFLRGDVFPRLLAAEGMTLAGAPNQQPDEPRDSARPASAGPATGYALP
jgi:predicted glycoside hydrolase/deacetylase ChbG (UPF0249 family)